MFEYVKKMKNSLLLIFLFSVFTGFSQDSVQVFNLLNRSKESLKNNDVKTALQFAHQALNHSIKKKYAKGESASNNQLGYIFESQSNYDSANFYLNKNIIVAQKHHLKNELAQAHNLIGLVLWHQSKYKEALPHHAISLSLYQETGNQKGLADTYAKTGNVFYDLSDFPKSFKSCDGHVHTGRGGVSQIAVALV